MGGRVGGRRRRRRLGALIGGTRGLIGRGRGGCNGFRMTGLFGLALPIVRVDLLHQHLHVVKGVRFPYTSDLILEPLRQPVVEMVPEGTFTITAYLACMAVELDDVLGDSLIVRHGQAV